MSQHVQLSYTRWAAQEVNVSVWRTKEGRLHLRLLYGCGPYWLLPPQETNVNAEEQVMGRVECQEAP